MHNGTRLRALAVDHKVHGDFAGHLTKPFQAPPLHVYGDQVLDRHHAFAHTRRRGQNAVLAQPDRNVAVGGRNKPSVVQQLADSDDLLPNFVCRHDAVLPQAQKCGELPSGSSVIVPHLLAIRQHECGIAAAYNQERARFRIRLPLTRGIDSPAAPDGQGGLTDAASGPVIGIVQR